MVNDKNNMSSKCEPITFNNRQMSLKYVKLKIEHSLIFHGVWLCYYLDDLFNFLTFPLVHFCFRCYILKYINSYKSSLQSSNSILIVLILKEFTADHNFTFFFRIFCWYREMPVHLRHAHETFFFVVCKIIFSFSMFI